MKGIILCLLFLPLFSLAGTIENKYLNDYDSLLIENNLDWEEIKNGFLEYGKQEFSSDDKVIQVIDAVYESNPSHKSQLVSLEKFEHISHFSNYSGYVLGGFIESLSNYVTPSARWETYDNYTRIYLSIYGLSYFGYKNVSTGTFCSKLKIIYKEFENKELADRIILALFIEQIFNADYKQHEDISIQYLDKKERRKFFKNDKSNADENDQAQIDPKFLGGESGLGFYIQQNIVYPSRSIEMGEQGTVHVQFVVEKNGLISDIVVVKKISKYLDEEAVRIIKALPKWMPGKFNDKLARVRFTIPIQFRLG